MVTQYVTQYVIYHKIWNQMPEVMAFHMQITGEYCEIFKVLFLQNISSGCFWIQKYISPLVISLLEM